METFVWPVWVGVPLVCIISATPMICLLFLLLSVNRSKTPAFRKRCATVVFAIPVIALLLYAAYLPGAPTDENIRIDLLFLYVALALDFLFWFALLVRFLIWSPDGTSGIRPR